MWLLYVKCHHAALQSTSLWMWLHGWSVMHVKLWKLSSNCYRWIKLMLALAESTGEDSVQACCSYVVSAQDSTVDELEYTRRYTADFEAQRRLRSASISLNVRRIHGCPPSMIGPSRIWNSLPQHVTSSTLYVCFFKAFLFSSSGVLSHDSLRQRRLL